MKLTTIKEMQEGGKTRQTDKSFMRDAGKIWTQAPKEIKEVRNIGAAKKLIKLYCKTLPI